MKYKIRKNTICPIFGCFKKLCISQLPSKEDIIKFIRYNKVQKNFRATAKSVIQVFKSFGYETSNIRSVEDKIKRLFNRYINFCKSYKRKSTHKDFKTKLEAFKTNCREIFNIAVCDCAEKCMCTKNTSSLFLTCSRVRRSDSIVNSESKINKFNNEKPPGLSDNDSKSSSDDEIYIDDLSKTINKSQIMLNMKPIIMMADTVFQNVLQPQWLALHYTQ